jgi:hypothetical protein
VGERGKKGRQDERQAKVKGKVKESRLTGSEKGWQEKDRCGSRGAGCMKGQEQG